MREIGMFPEGMGVESLHAGVYDVYTRPESGRRSHKRTPFVPTRDLKPLSVRELT